MQIERSLIYLALIGVPVGPLLYTWLVLVTSGLATPRFKVGLIVITLSFGLLVTAIFWDLALGPDYSMRRMVTIYANLVIAASVCVLARSGPPRSKVALALSCVLVGLDWAYLAVVNSVV